MENLWIIQDLVQDDINECTDNRTFDRSGSADDTDKYHRDRPVNTECTLRCDVDLVDIHYDTAKRHDRCGNQEYDQLRIEDLDTTDFCCARIIADRTQGHTEFGSHDKYQQRCHTQS